MSIKYKLDRLEGLILPKKEDKSNVNVRPKLGSLLAGVHVLHTFRLFAVNTICSFEFSKHVAPESGATSHVFCRAESEFDSEI